MSDEKSIRIITFSGKETDWRMWKLRFLAKASHNGYRNLLLGTVEVPDEDEDIQDIGEDDKAKLKLRELNI